MKIYYYFWLSFFIKKIYYLRYFTTIVLGSIGFKWEYIFIKKIIVVFLRKKLNFILKANSLKKKTVILYYNFYLSWPLCYWKFKQATNLLLKIYPAIFYILKNFAYKKILKFSQTKNIFKAQIYFKISKIPLRKQFKFYRILLKELLYYYRFCNKKKNLWFIVILIKTSCKLTLTYRFIAIKKLISYNRISKVFIWLEYSLHLEFFYPKNYKTSLYFYIIAKDYFLKLC